MTARPTAHWAICAPRRARMTASAYSSESGRDPGACAARNQGLDAARSDVIIFLDSDDILEPFALEDRLMALNEPASSAGAEPADTDVAQPSIDLLVTQARCFRKTPGDLDVLWNVDYANATPSEDLERFLRRDIPWQTTGATWRRAALRRLGGWDEQAPSGQDYELHVRAILLGMRYARRGCYDYHWRKGAADRASVGLASIQAQHWAYRAVIAERIVRMMQQTGQLTPLRRDLLAGQFWTAADNVRQRATIRQATRIWDRARVLGLITLRRWLEGSAYLVGFGRRHIRESAKAWIERAWPVELRLKPSPTQTNAPIPPEWIAHVDKRRRALGLMNSRSNSSRPGSAAPAAGKARRPAKPPAKRRRRGQ